MITLPTDPSWTGRKLVDEVLDARQELVKTKRYGPYRIETGAGWDQYLDQDYMPCIHCGHCRYTVRCRLKLIDGVEGVGRKKGRVNPRDFDFLLTPISNPEEQKT